MHAWSARALIHIDRMFVLWHGDRSGELDRATLQHGMAAIQGAFHSLLEDGTGVPNAKVQSFSHGLLRLEAARWTFVREEGVEPTNNAAERALRPAVLWRKGCFGTQSDGGSRYVERMLTVIATCKQQDRHLLSFLTESLEAHWAGTPPPCVIQTPRAFTYLTTRGSARFRRSTSHRRGPGKPCRASVMRTNAKSQTIGPVLPSLTVPRTQAVFGNRRSRSSTR